MGIFKKKEIDVKHIKKYKSFDDYLYAYRREIREAFIVPEVYERTGTTLDDFMRDDICLKKQLTYDEAVDCHAFLTAQINSFMPIIQEIKKTYEAFFNSKAKKLKSGKNFSSVDLINYDEVNIKMIQKVIREKRDVVSVERGKEIIDKDLEAPTTFLKAPKTFDDCVAQINEKLVYIATDCSDLISTYISMAADTQVLSLKHSILNDTLADMAKKRK